jgi:hypothetical protein
MHAAGLGARAPRDDAPRSPRVMEAALLLGDVFGAQ